MFFQSFSYLQQFDRRATNVTLAVSPNALEGTMIGSTTLNQSSTDPFAITTQTFSLNTAKAINGLPIVQAYMQGYASDVSPYFMIDFSNDKTVVWNSSCTQTVALPESSCFDAPTYLVVSYDNVTDSGVTFTGKQFGGYLVTGKVYLDTICYDTTFCKVIEVFAGENVTIDAWLYDQEGAYGILGYGPNSPFWNQYIDPVTATATYLIALADPDSILVSNITLGSADT